MRLRFTKLNFLFLAIALPLAPLAMNAQTTSPQQAAVFKTTDIHVGVFGAMAAGSYQIGTTQAPGDTSTLDGSLSGGRVGLQGGVDFNLKGLVVGGIADWSWSNAQFKFGETDAGPDYPNGPVSEELRFSVKQMTTIRVRAGRHYGRLLPYVHGGLLVADSGLTDTGTGIISDSLVSRSSNHIGFVAGAGLEYFLSRRYSLSTEYAYNHVNGINVSNLFSSDDDVTSASENLHFSTLNVGFNYHF